MYVYSYVSILKLKIEICVTYSVMYRGGRARLMFMYVGVDSV